MNGQRAGRRVVITGMGAVSPLGNSPGSFFEALLAGKSSIRRMTEWEQCSYLGSPVRLPEEFAASLPRSLRRSMSPVSLYSAFAAKQAAADSGLTPEMLASGRTGCVIGSTMGGSTAISESYRILYSGGGLADMSSMQFFKCVSHTAAFNTAHCMGITGTVLAPCAACASGTQAVGMARDLIAGGVQDTVLCGGAEELSPEVSGSFEVIFAGFSPAERTPETASRPFDAARSGLVCGEGAGILVLEELEHAKARGAHIYGEIAGYATCCCGTQIGQSDSESIVRCLNLVYADSGLPPESTAYVNAHATSTVQGDLAEARALAEFFGSARPYVSSLKGNIGHTLGASGTLELIASVEMMNRSILLPTRNLETPGEGCKGLNYVMKSPVKAETGLILKNSFAFGGINAALLCSRYCG